MSLWMSILIPLGLVVFMVCLFIFGKRPEVAYICKYCHKEYPLHTLECPRSRINAPTVEY